MKKKIISTLLCLAMLLSTLLIPVSVNAETGIMEVTSLEEIDSNLWNSEITGFKLMNDIVAPEDFTSLSTLTKDLDGNGKTISGLKVSLCVGMKTNTVKNLTLEGSLTTTGSDVALLAQWTNNDITVDNCKVNVTITDDATSDMTWGNIGGFFGSVGEGGPIIMTNCTVNGTLTDSTTNGGNTGGFVGSVSAPLSMTGCVNNMDITLSSASAWGGKIGGLVGNVASTGSVTLTDCVNNGDISGVSRTGGMIAEIEGSYELNGCINNGTISCPDALGGPGTVGGFVGCGGSSQATSTIDNCVNFGAVTSTKVAGGFIGEPWGTVDRVKNCANVGNISATKGEPMAGGLAGNVTTHEFTLVENFASIGDISSTNAGGGLFGYYKVPKGTLKNCIITGKITGTEWYAGGFIGRLESWNTASTLTIENSYYEAAKNVNINAMGAYRKGENLLLSVHVIYTAEQIDKTFVGGGTGENAINESHEQMNKIAWNNALSMAAVRQLSGIRAAAKMTALNVGEDWLITEGSPIPAALADVLLTEEAQSGLVIYEGLQYSAAEGGKMKVRFASTISTLNYSEVTYKLTRIVKGGNPADETTSNTDAYATLVGHGEENATVEYDAEDGYYYAVGEVTDVPADTTVTFVVTPVMKGMNGAADAEGMTYAVVFTNGELVCQYQW